METGPTDDGYSLCFEFQDAETRRRAAPREGPMGRLILARSGVATSEEVDWTKLKAPQPGIEGSIIGWQPGVGNRTPQRNAAETTPKSHRGYPTGTAKDKPAGTAGAASAPSWHMNANTPLAEIARNVQATFVFAADLNTSLSR